MNFQVLLSKMEEWLYEEGEEASQKVYNSKLHDLRTVIEKPINARQKAQADKLRKEAEAVAAAAAAEAAAAAAAAPPSEPIVETPADPDTSLGKTADDGGDSPLEPMNVDEKESITKDTPTAV